MKNRMPLYMRIVLILVFNLVVAAFLLGWVLKSYYGLGKDDLIASTVERRMVGMARLLLPALDNSDRDQWDEILEDTGETHGVELAIYRPNVILQYAGSEREIPEELKDLLRERFSRERAESDYRPPSPPDGRPPRRSRRINEMLDELTGDEDTPRRTGPPMRRGPEDSGPGRKPVRPGTVVIEEMGKYGKPPVEMAAVHLWIKPEQGKPHDLMLVVWKADGASQVFFSWKPLFITLAGLLLLSAILWVPFVYRITRRLGILTRGAESVAEGSFEIDVASDRGDELGRLSRSIQRMSKKLDEYVSGQKRFLGDIAHELCSPLVRIRMGLGVLEHQLEKEDLSKLENLGDEVEELSQLVNELLDFSKASLRPERLELEQVDIEEVCLGVAKREAPSGGVEIVAGQGMVIMSREDLLRRALANVVRNAVRYAGDAGPVIVTASEKTDAYEIQVDDSGPGLPDEWLEKIFEPFSRPEDARTRESGGSGLGLAIAKTCVTSLGGEIVCRNRAEGGLSVVITLPCNHSANAG